MPHEPKAPSACGDVAKALRPASRALLLGLLLLQAPALLAQSLTFTHFAGTTGGGGRFDGSGSQASFSEPNGVTVDGAGNLYVADTANHTIRKISPTGAVTTLAGLAGSPASRDGRGGVARCAYPIAVAAQPDGTVFFTESGTGSLRRISPSGDVSTVLTGFYRPACLAVDKLGTVYVCMGNSLLRVSPTGASTLFTEGTEIGLSDPLGSGFFNPSAASVDGAGNVYVADTGNHTIRRITQDGVVTTVAGRRGAAGYVDGNASSARFREPVGVAVDSTGIIYVSDGSMTIRRITPDGEVSTLAGSPGPSGLGGSADGAGPAARFRSPRSLAIHPDGSLVVADTSNQAIRRVSPAGVVTTLAGGLPRDGADDGPGTTATFFGPTGVATDRDGSLYVADGLASVIRSVSPDGTVTTVAGVANSVGSADGIGSEARFAYPQGLAVDGEGNVLVADSQNHAIRLVTPSGTVSTLAGLAGVPGSEDGTSSEARFGYPTAVALDEAGNAYVADSNSCRIRKRTASGVVTTLAGGFCGTIDGSASQALFNHPWGIAVGPDGSLYVTEYRGHTIRRMDPDGIVTTLAGLAGNPGIADGTGSTARFAYPMGISIDSSGYLYVAEYRNNLIRKVSPSGVVTTVCGSGGYPGATDGTGAEARVASPRGVAIGPADEVLVADTDNRSIRMGRPALPDVATIDTTTGPVGQARQLGSSPQTGFSWRWEVVRRPTGSSAVLSATTSPNPTFTPDVPDVYVFRLTVSNGLQTSITTVPLTAYVTALVSGSTSVCAGGSAAVTATLFGTPPWTLTWSDGLVQSDVGASPITRAVSPTTTTTYFVTEVSDADGLGSTEGSATIAVSGPAPPAPIISAPASAGAESWYRIASVAATPGSTYSWTITNGTIVTGNGSPTIRFRTRAPGPLTLTVREVTAGGCTSPEGSATVAVTPVGTSTAFYPVPGCRILDSRSPGGASGGLPLRPNASRWWSVRGLCGIPSGARAVAANVTVTEPAAPGHVTAYSGATWELPPVSTVNFLAGQTRANNTIIAHPHGFGALTTFNASPGTVHVIIDVNGFFQ